MTVLDQRVVNQEDEEQIEVLMERKLQIREEWQKRERRLVFKIIDKEYEMSEMCGLKMMTQERLREGLTEVSNNQVMLQLMSQITSFEQQPELRKDFDRFDFIREQLSKKA